MDWAGCISIAKPGGSADRTGKIVIKLKADMVGQFAEGRAPVKVGGKWGYIDKTGRMVITPQFDDAFPFSEGLAVVVKDEKRGFVDQTGKLVIPFKFGLADAFSEGLAAVWLEGKWGFIDKTGKTGHPAPVCYFPRGRPAAPVCRRPGRGGDSQPVGLHRQDRQDGHSASL